MMLMILNVVPGSDRAIQGAFSRSGHEGLSDAD